MKLENHISTSPTKRLIGKEKIEKFKADVIDAIMASPIDPHSFPKDYRERAAEVVKNRSDEAIIEAMTFHTPKDYADLLLM